MKNLFLVGLFLFNSLVAVAAQDCFYCPPTFFTETLPIHIPEWPIEYVTIRKVDYERNKDASYCKRPVEMIDTIVLHHSETRSTATAEAINEMHLANGFPKDPWLMIAYSYVINSPYKGSATPVAQVSEGRPLDIVGAHAGSNIFIPMDSVQKKLWDERKITCGKEDGPFKHDSTLVKNGKIKANVTTIGLVVVGNYAPVSSNNPNGYDRKNPRYPTQQTLELIARTSCQLQKKYPRMKYIKWHNYYHATTCPGNIKDFISQIKTIARNFGCEFF